MAPDLDVLVIGAGMTGLAAGRDLSAAGKRVAVVDKGRGLGGRLAGKRFGGAVFDNGAQYVTARDPRFRDMMQAWAQDGHVRPWKVKPRRSEDDTVRWRGAPAMTAMAKQMAVGLDIHNSVHITSIALRDGKWVCTASDGDPYQAASVLMTLPVPQALDLLRAGEVALDAQVEARLEAILYHRCFSVMAVLDGPSGLALSEGVSLSDGPTAWIADNQLKGISEVPAVTLHASPAYSLARWDEDREETAQEMLNHAAPHLGAGVKEFRIHGWKFSMPVQVQEEDCMKLIEDPQLVLAGDAFGGGRVEGAVLSGWAASRGMA